MTYRIIRHFRERNSRVVARGLTLAEAQEHCADLNTSSRTAWKTSTLRITKRHGEWFDGYEEDSK